MKASKSRNDRIAWGVSLMLWAGAGYCGLSILAMDLGAAMHDVYCPDH